MANYTYSPQDISVTVGGVDIHGFPDGDFVSVEFAEDAFSAVQGADGEVTWNKNPNTLATITLTLMATSPSNDYLSTLHITDKLSGLGTAPIMIKDTKGRDLFISEAARIMKFANMTKGKEAGTREWKLTCASSQMFVGGN